MLTAGGLTLLHFTPEVYWTTREQNGNKLPAFWLTEAQRRFQEMANNTQKDPEDWVSGSDPMTGAQGSYLKTLSEQAHKRDPTNKTLTKAEASRLIDELREDADLSKVER